MPHSMPHRSVEAIKATWSSLKDHPLAIVTAAVLATGAIVWKVDGAIRVSRRDERIADLKEKLVQEQARNADSPKGATARSTPKAPTRELPYKVYAVSDRRDQGNWLNGLVNQLSQEGEA